MSSSSIRAGRAFIELFLKDGISKALVPIEARMKGFGDKIKSIGGSLAAMGGVASAPLALSAKNFASFETTMANVATVLDEPQKHMATMKAQVQALAMEFGESTETIGMGLYEIISAQIPAGEAMSVLRAAMISAKGGVTDTAQATNMLISILNAYKIPAKDAADVTDLLFQVMKRGTTTLPELAQYIGNVVATAKAAELSIEEMGAAIATMTRNGIKTDMAMTSLNNVLSEFIKPSEKGREIAEKYGIDMSIAALKSKGLLAVIKDLQKIPKDALAEIFPDARGIRGVFSITDDVAGFKTDMEEMKNRAGSSMAAFNNHAETTTVHLAQLWEFAKSLSVTVGSLLAPRIQRLALIAKTFIEPLNELVLKNKNLIQIFAGVAGAATFVGTVMLGIGTAMGIMGGIFAGVLSLVLNPLSYIVAAIAGVGAALLAGGAMWLTYSNGGKAALDTLGESISYLSYMADEAFMGMADALAAGDIELAGQIAMLGLQAVWHEGLNQIASMFDSEWAQVLRLLLGGDLGAAGEHAIQALWHSFANGIAGINLLWKYFWFGLSELALSMGFDIGAAWKSICDNIAMAINGILGAIQSAMDWLESLIGKADEAGEKTAKLDPEKKKVQDDIDAGAARARKKAEDEAKAKRAIEFAKSMQWNQEVFNNQAAGAAENKEAAKTKADSTRDKALSDLNDATEKARTIREEQNKKLEAELAAAKQERDKRAKENAAKVVPVMDAAEEADKKAQGFAKDNGTFSAAGAIAMAGREGSEITDIQRKQYKESVALNKKIDRLLQQMDAQNRKLGLPAIFT